MIEMFLAKNSGVMPTDYTVTIVSSDFTQFVDLAKTRSKGVSLHRPDFREGLIR
jgi:hypothetical protein